MSSVIFFFTLAIFPLFTPTIGASDRSIEDDAVVLGDIKLNLHRNAINDRAARWPDGDVPYILNDNLADATKSKILAAMHIIESSVNSAHESCIRFTPRTSQLNYVEVIKGTGCYSAVGMENRGGPQTVSIGEGCEFKGVIMHELLHALGFYHEHSRYDRDDHVKIDTNNIKDDNDENFEKMTPSEIDLLNTPFDLGSIMNYDPYTLASDTRKPVMITSPDKAGDIFQMGQRLALSDMDVLRIQRFYGCTEDTSHVVRNEEDNMVLACNFQTGLCGMTNGGGHFNWVTHKGASPSGCLSGHSTGTDNYLLAAAKDHNGQTAQITTPLTSVGAICIDFYYFVGHSSSALNILASGPSFVATKLQFSNAPYQRWTRQQLKLAIPSGFQYQISFKAILGSGDVAVDDIRLYRGACN